MDASRDRISRRQADAPARRERVRTVVAFGLGGLGALFAVLNLDDVDVNWIFGTWSTPLIVAIAISFVLGAAVGFLVARRRGEP